MSKHWIETDSSCIEKKERKKKYPYHYAKYDILQQLFDINEMIHMFWEIILVETV